MEWTYYNAKFDFDKIRPDLIHCPWTGHRKFAYDLVRFMKPKQITELGTYYGHSFFTFCQAVEDEGLSCECVAIDTWKGDTNSGFYNEGVFHTFRSFVQNYPQAKWQRQTFDEAVQQVEDRSIDLLHIDGLHTFEAVKQDYETWLPKLKENGIILFHDITVFRPDFGVHQLWDILAKSYPSMEFAHSYGLGVLFPKGVDPKFTEVIKANKTMKGIYET